MGRVSAPHGVKGGIKVQPYTATPAGLLAHGIWWLQSGTEWREYEVRSASAQARTVVAMLAGCESRDAAARLRGSRVAVPRDALPKAADNEFYWIDLIGLAVVNEAGQDFGRVARILETGANDVLVVENGRERLIPFVATVVREVDTATGVIRVDWGADY